MGFRGVGSMPRQQEELVLKCHSKGSQSQVFIVVVVVAVVTCRAATQVSDTE